MVKRLLMPLVILLFTFSFIPSSCDEPTPLDNTNPTAPYGTITIVRPDFEFESTDPILLYESFWVHSLYDALITWDDDGNYIGSVAESWSIGEDGNTWTFKIRDDIVFHNNDPLTAYDVKFSIDRLASEEATSPWSSILRANLHTTAVVDDYTFIYRTNTPEPRIIQCFA